MWRWPGKLHALFHCIQASSMKEIIWRLRLRHEVVYARTHNQQVEVLNLEPQSLPLSPLTAFLSLTLYYLYLTGQKPLAEMFILRRKQRKPHPHFFSTAET